MSRKWLESVVLMLCLLALGACASLTSDVDPPKVTMESFRATTHGIAATSVEAIETYTLKVTYGIFMLHSI